MIFVVAGLLNGIAAGDAGFQDINVVERLPSDGLRLRDQLFASHLHQRAPLFCQHAVASQTAQFVGGGYAVFGMVVEGLEVVDKIAAIPTGPDGPFSRDVPFRNALIIKAEVLAAPKAAPKKP